MLADFDEMQKKFLFDSARRYIWWKTPEEALAYPQKILAQVMNIGVLEDMGKLLDFFPPEPLIEILNSAEAGQFNERSWCFWHNKFSLEAPPMPSRKFS